MDGLGVKQKVCSSPAAAARSGCFKGEGDLLIFCSLKTATLNLLLVVSAILLLAMSLPHRPPQFMSVGLELKRGFKKRYK